MSAADVTLMTNNRLKSRPAAHSAVNYSVLMSEQQSDDVDVVVVVDDADVFPFDTSRIVTVTAHSTTSSFLVRVTSDYSLM